jgi:RHS repeat-associated protein
MRDASIFQLISIRARECRVRQTQVTDMPLQRIWSEVGPAGLLISALVTLCMSLPAQAQLAPVAGTHYAARASDTGFMGAVNSQGSYSASVPLNLPGARGGLPVPLGVVYGGNRVGAAGLGWDVPLSYIFRDTTIAHHRPGRERLRLMLNGRGLSLVRNTDNTAWLASSNATQLEVRDLGGGMMVMYDGEGRTYSFSTKGATSGSQLINGNLFLLVGIKGSDGNQATLQYGITAPALPGGGAGLAINLNEVDYNVSPSNASCFKHRVLLNYGAAESSPLAMSMLGGTVLTRVQKLSGITVSSRASCDASAVALRSYTFNYQPDTDTKLPRLQSVTMKGQQGTAEAGVTLPVAIYSYGSIVDRGTDSITYEFADAQGPLDGLTTNHNSFGISYTTMTNSSEPHSPSDVLLDNFTQQTFVDLNGDGRPDFRGDGGTYQSRPSVNGKTIFSRETVFPASLAFDTRDKIHSSFIGGGSPPGLPVRVNPSIGDTLTQLIDMNGDGRLDVVETVLPDIDHWIIHLNRPDPTDPRKSLFADPINIPVAQMRTALNTTGLSFGRVPLARRTTVPVNFELGTQLKRTITEFELRDINGDGYPDFVYNASAVRTSGAGATVPGDMIGSRDVKALINMAGVHLASGTSLFGSPVTLEAGGTNGCGIARWEADPSSADGGILNEVCGFEDVNGDGIADRIISVVQNGQVVAQAALGTGVLSQMYASGALVKLPGPLARTETSLTLILNGTYVPSACTATPPSSTFDLRRTRALRDINGDGISDYITRSPSSDGWIVHMGTGAGYAGPVTIVSPQFELSLERSACGGSGDESHVSATPTGLYDIDGDGQPELVNLIFPRERQSGHWDIFQLKAPAAQLDVGKVASVPAAGRLTKIDNGYGASTRVGYKSAKEDTQGAHNLPYPEIVVSAVATTDSSDTTINRLLSSTRYSYGGASLIFDSVADAFVFPGYQRTIQLVSTDPAAPSEAVATITDTYPLEPFSAAAFPNAASRYKRYQRVGKVSDVTTLSGNLGPDPWALLGTNVMNDARRISGSHSTYDSKLLASGLRMPDTNEVCIDMMFPYDFAASTSNANRLSDDLCTQIGLSFRQEVSAWRGTPETADPFTSTATVKTRTRTESVDDFGRVTALSLVNDLSTTDDDLCVKTDYAAPPESSTNERVLSAPKSSTTTVGVCSAGNTTILAKQSWEYDKQAAGTVTAGFVTSKTVSRRRTDNGAVINDATGKSDIRLFDADFDAAGNPKTVTMARDDGAMQKLTNTYDAFGLALTSAKNEATNAGGVKLPALLTSIDRDPVTLYTTSTTDPNGAQSGNTFDGFGRVRQSSVVPAGGGASGVLSSIKYLGFAQGETGGRKIEQKVFTDPVNSANVDSTAGRIGTTFLDSLGRELRTDVKLGADYANKIMKVGQRTYDLLDRVKFEADAFPEDQSFDSAYGTTYHFNTDGTLRCFIRGRGQQAFTDTTNEANELYPTCFGHPFFDNREHVDMRDALGLLNPTPATLVNFRSDYSAIGRLLSRYSWQFDSDFNETKLESMEFSYDRLGQMTAMTRFGGPANSASPVTTNWKYDSLGRLIEFTDPGSATQFSSYDTWGGLTLVQWSDATTATATDRRIIAKFDALGRTTHSEDRTNNTVDAETVNDYLYDQPVNNSTPPVTATNVLGRLSKATSPSSTVSFSYDGLGRMNARVFTDKLDGNKVYVEKYATHADGSPSGLDFLLPDTQFTKTEHVNYTYDSAGRTRSVSYGDGSITQPVFSATGTSDIDVFGRIHQARYGVATYTASYADTGRRLINSVKVTGLAGSGENSREFTYPAPTNFASAFDPLGRERARRETKTVNGASTVSTLAYTYKLLGQLESIVRTPAATSSTLPNMTFAYDSLGNLGALTPSAGSNGAKMSYQSVDRDRICSIAYGSGTPSSTCNVTYDGVGNITRQPTRAGSTRTFTWFANGQVKRVADSAGHTADFRYDAFGDLEKLDLTSNTSPDTRHDRHFGGLISKREEVVSGTKKVVVTRAIAGPGVLATRHGSGSADPWTFAFSDTRGNRFMTDQTGAFVQDVDYQAFGEADSKGAQPGSQKFTSEQWNGGDALAALGLSHLGARLYDPVIGRFLSRDPLIIPRSAVTTNPYAFAANDPVNLSDPTGMKFDQNADQEKIEGEGVGNDCIICIDVNDIIAVQKALFKISGIDSIVDVLTPTGDFGLWSNPKNGQGATPTGTQSPPPPGQPAPPATPGGAGQPAPPATPGGNTGCSGSYPASGCGGAPPSSGGYPTYPAAPDVVAQGSFPNPLEVASDIAADSVSNVLASTAKGVAEYGSQGTVSASHPDVVESVRPGVKAITGPLIKGGGELLLAAATAGGSEVGEEVLATGFRGSKGFELKNAPYQSARNSAATIGGREYSAHALDQMQNRGLLPSVVDNAIRTGRTYPTGPGTKGFFDAANGIRVITNATTGRVITVIRGAP